MDRTIPGYPITGLSLTRRQAIAAAAGVVAVALPGLHSARAARLPALQSASTFLSADSLHDITIAMGAEVYDAMIQTFIDSGDKDWIDATVTIDGAVYERAGLRLKGNSSVMALRGDRGGRPFGDIIGEWTGDEVPEGSVSIEERNVVDGEGSAGGPSSDLSADAPEELPWLIRLDRNVEGQNHGGITNVVIRSNRSATALNEAVALELLQLAGLASQQAAPVRFAVNERAAVYRLAIELPDDTWMARHFSADGLLWKAEAGGDFSYRGTDPDSYTDVFDLEAGGTGDNAADFAPLMSFLEFINTDDDATFLAQAPERVDTDSFATYLAMMELIANFDDIDGPGNNAYLYTDPNTGVMTVVPWDMNLAFEMIGAGGGPRIVGVTPGESSGRPGPGMAVQIGENGVHDGEGRGGPGGMPGANPLVQRFTAATTYADLIQERIETLRSDLYASGTAAEILQRWVDVLTVGAADLLDAETIASESESVKEFFSAS